MDLALRVLVTGFVPFGGDPYNPSGVTAEWLHGRTVHTGRGGNLITAKIIGKGKVPVQFANEKNGAAPYIENLIVDTRPDVVINIGMAADKFEIEEKAHDLKRDPSIKAGSAGYANQYTTTLPVEAVAKAIESAGGVVQIDSDAGGYVCEDVFYHVMRLAKRAPGDIRILRAGFIHVPKYVIPDNGATPNTLEPGVVAVPQSLINNAIYKAIEATVADVSPEEYEAIQRKSAPRR